MVDDRFEWDEAKAAANAARHGVSFEAAKLVFDDPFAIERLDDRENCGEERFNIVGMVEGRILFVSYTVRHDVIRIISARGAEPTRGAGTMKKTAKTTKRPKIDWSRFDAMTDKDRHATALSDRDARPMTEKDFARMKRTPQVKIIRRALGLSQDDFAARYQIPIGTLRDWEQGRATPDQAARAYLKVIARNPDVVRKALA